MLVGLGWGSSVRCLPCKGNDLGLIPNIQIKSGCGAVISTMGRELQEDL